MYNCLTINHYEGDCMATLADSIKNEDCYEIEDLAEEFGVGTLRMRQILAKALDSKAVPKLIKKDGRRILYAPQMVEALRAAKEKGLLGKFNKSRHPVISTKNAKLIITVPIFDEEIAEMLKSRYKNEAGMVKFLQTQLFSNVNPILAKKRELKERYEQELQELMATEASM